jgi:hypothetical protein
MDRRLSGKQPTKYEFKGEHEKPGNRKVLYVTRSV